MKEGGQKISVFWFCVTLVAFCVSLAIAFEIGSFMVFGLGLLVLLPATVIWYVTQLFLLNILRKNFGKT